MGDGEGYTRDTSAVLQRLKVMEVGQEMYIVKRFESTGFLCPPVSVNRNPLTRVTNALTTGLNDERHKIPKHIIVILDRALAEYTHEYADRMMIWLLTEIWRQKLARNKSLKI